MSPVSLATLRKGARGVVVDVRDDAQSLGDEAQSTVSRRLLELGFVPGEPFEVDRGGLARRRSDGGAPRQHDVRPAPARGDGRDRRTRGRGARREQPGGDLDPMRLALVGVPNCGKTALFNRLTGSRQHVANYAGVTVERKEGSFTGPARQRLYKVLDLPGAYSLTPTTLDEAITRDFLLGRLADEPPPDFVVCVVDATNLRLNLRLVLELRDLGVPMVVALNMSDLAAERGYQLDRARLEQELGVPVVETVAVDHDGERLLVDKLEALPHPGARAAGRTGASRPSTQIQGTQREVRRILQRDRLRRAAAQAGARAPRRAGDAPVRRAADPRGHPVLRVPGRVQLGRRADGADRRRRRRARHLAAARRCRTARCAACWSTASSPASAACWCSCRRS